MSSQVDELYQRMGDDLELKIPRIEDSEIAKYFAGKTLFITGITGFMGKCLAEKILRNCYEVKHIYFMMRDKKNEGLEVTLRKYFTHPIFNVLRKMHPNFEKKVTAIKGDLFLENLGMSPEDRKTLVSEIDIIYHNASNVKFDTRVNIALKVNILGTKHILDLAEECKQLKLFMYVSTAYSHCYRQDIDETFYPISDTLDTVHDAIKKDLETENGLSEDAFNALIGKFPNIYTYTKAFSEDLVRQYSEKNPNCAFVVYRPSIVINAYKEPLSGWVGNRNGPVFLFLAVGLGIVRIGYYQDYPMDFVPVDMTINALLMVTWDLGTRWKAMDKASVYNYGSSTLNPIALLPFYEPIKDYGPTEGSSKSVWINTVTSCSSLHLFWVLHYLLHFIPACLGDLALLVIGKKPMFVSIFFSVNKHMDKINYFANGNWKIYCPETIKALNRMNYDDQHLFYCDIRTLDWENFVFILWRGLKCYILKEDLQSNAGRQRYVLLWYLHYGLLTILTGVLFYFVIKIFGF